MSIFIDINIFKHEKMVYQFTLFFKPYGNLKVQTAINCKIFAIVHKVLKICNFPIIVIQSTQCRSVVLNAEFDPSAERVQDSEGRKVNGVEQLILNVNIYKGGASETRISTSWLYKSRAYIQSELWQQNEALVCHRLLGRGELPRGWATPTSPHVGVTTTSSSG